jgi:hypothetical protein
MYNRDRVPVQKTEGHESVLSIRETVILVGICQTFEHSLNVRKIEPMIPTIGFSLALIPSDPYIHIVSTFSVQINRL